MAVLKHIASKNSDYGRSLEYLMFQHDEKTQKPLLDECGHMVLRDEYYLDGLNCDPFSFDMECRQLNALYHKNQKKDEIKSHHYIISFDPRDVTECGLTGKKAQELGLEFADRFFPGHQALVCTHMDGHNGSGNVHVHIVINSLRKLDVPRWPFMEREIDCKAGYKHHVTRKYLAEIKKGLMDITEWEWLHQVDLLSPAPVKISDREYRKAQREQEKLEAINQEIIADGLKPARTKYQTQKQFLRDAILDISEKSESEKDFISGMEEKYGIIVKDHRGRYSYLHPERERYTTGRALGSHFEKEYLLSVFEKNTEIYKYDPAFDYASEPVRAVHFRSELRLVTDLQNNVKAKMSAAYAQRVKITNLQEMAKTIIYIQEHGYDSREQLYESYFDSRERWDAARKAVKSTETEIKTINEQIHYAGQYYSNKSVHEKYQKSWNKKKFKESHESELELYQSAVNYFKRNHGGKIRNLKSLKEEREKLLQLKDNQYDAYYQWKDYQSEIWKVCKNVEAIFARERTKERAQKINKHLSTMEL